MQKLRKRKSLGFRDKEPQDLTSVVQSAPVVEEKPVAKPKSRSKRKQGVPTTFYVPEEVNAYLNMKLYEINGGRMRRKDSLCLADIYNEAIDEWMQKRGYPSYAELKAQKEQLLMSSNTAEDIE